MADFVSSRLGNLEKIVQKTLEKETWKFVVQKNRNFKKLSHKINPFIDSQKIPHKIRVPHPLTESLDYNH
jgi:hypothetical protein